MTSQENSIGTIRARMLRRIGFIFLLAVLVVTGAQAQLDNTCTISILNRSARVASGGQWIISDVPANQGPVRARATCVFGDVTRVGESTLINVPPNGRIENVGISFGSTPVPVPARMTLGAPSQILSGGATLQLTAMVTYPSGEAADVTTGSGTTYTTSNRSIGTVSPAGLVTALTSGTLIIGAMNDGALALIKLTVASTGDRDGDGMPDDWEIANGLNPDDPSDALLDADGDALTNSQEFLIGTNPRLADTDGDGIRDGLEVQTGFDPLDPNSYNLSAALQTLSVQPSTVGFVFNTASGEVSKQLTVTGGLIDGTSINLTARSRGTAYTSSDLSIVSFGSTDGQIFAGASGTANIVITNNTFSATVHVTVRTFEPAGVSALELPGRVEHIRVRNGLAYIAAGPAGLLVVDVHDPAHPAIVGSFDTPGSANDVAIDGNRAYIADLSALLIFDIANPAAPTLLGTLPLPGEVREVSVEGGVAWVAAHTGGLVGVDVTNPVSPVIIAAVSNGNVDQVVVKDGRVYIYADNRVVIFDVSRPVSPRQIGSTFTTSDVRSMVVAGNVLYLAAYDLGLRALDITDPSHPAEISSVGGTGVFIPADLVLVGNTAIIADVYFVDSIPLVDVTQPSTMQFRSVIDMTTFGDYDGHGIDADGQYAYVVAQNFSSGASVLLIAQHNRVSDDANVAPTVSIAAPASTTLAAGRQFDLDVTATDDAGVAAVRANVNGIDYYANNAPYRFHFRAPLSGTLTITVTATDYAGHTSQTSRNYTIVDEATVTTTISGLVRIFGGAAVGGGVTVRSIAGTATTDVSGHYTISGVPSWLGGIEVHATTHLSDGPYSGTTNVTAVRGSTAALTAPDLVLENIAGARGALVDIGGYPNGMKVRDGFAYLATGVYGLQIVDVADPRKPAISGSADTPGNANSVALSGDTALIADGDAGMQRIDVTKPYAPVITGTLALPAPALEVTASASIAAAALGTGGLALIDYHANPPALLGTITNLGEVRDVAFDGGVLVALTSTELVTLNVSNPASPLVLGRVALVGFYTIEANGGFVQAADLYVNIALIDVHTPAAPIVTSQYIDNWVRRVTRLNTYLFDATSQSSIPVNDARYSPPQRTSTLNLIFNLAGSAIAADSDFVYEAGTSEQIDQTAHSAFNRQSRLAIVPHNLVIDDKGIPPTVTVHAPASAINGEQITITVDAADDIALRDTTVSVDGAFVATFQDSSYSFSYTVPAGATSVAIHAVAADVAGNTRIADAQISVHPDPLTTLTGAVRNVSAQRVPNARVTAGSLHTTADANGNYSLAGVPTLDPISVNASGRLNGSFLTGSVTVSTFVRGGTTPFADITVDSPPPGTSSSVALAGYGNAVRIAGRYALVAAGAGGLQVVDADDPGALVVVATLPLAGQLNDIRLDGNRAYLAAGDAGVHIVDITAPLSPQLVTTIDTPGNALELSVNGGSLYVADGASGIQVITISGTPSIVANLATTPASAQHVSADGTRLVYIGDDGNLHAADITNPAAPVAHGTAYTGVQQSLLLRGTLVHLAGGYYQIYSIADLDNLVQTGIAYGNYGEVAVAGLTAAVTDVYAPVLTTYDISNEQALQYRDQIDWYAAGYSSATGIDIDSAYAYITADDNTGGGSEPHATGSTRLVAIRHTLVLDTHGVAPTVQIISPSNNATLIAGSSTTLTANATDDVAVASVRFFVNGTEIATVKTAPFELSWAVPDPGSYSIYAIATDFGGSSTQSSAVTVNVINDPLTTVTGTVRTQNGVVVPGARVELSGLFADTAGDGTYSFESHSTIDGALTIRAAARVAGAFVSGSGGPADPVAGGTTHIDIVLAAPPIGPIATHSMDTPGERIAAANSTVYAAGRTSGLGLIDLRLPDHPVALGRVDFIDDAEAVTVNGTQLFVAAGDAGVHLADVTSPLAPAHVSTLDTPGFARDLALGPNGLVFIADSEAGLQVADFSNPLAPVIVANTSLPGGARSLAYAPGGYVIVGSAPVSHGSGGSDETVSVVDVHTPNAPVVMGSQTFPGDARRIAVRGTLAYVASGNGVIVVIDFSTPAAPHIVRNDHSFGQPSDLAISGAALIVAGGYESNVLTVADISSEIPNIVRPIGFPTLCCDFGQALAVDGELAVVLLNVQGARYIGIAKYRNTDGSLVAARPGASQFAAR
ncbi:MAG TPA: Ig-like domain-containing protein [Thermoanaerobaculia bacterium]|nr:Ig-like domain-containing protein [Thermoanaerobaculia bacterium]